MKAARRRTRATHQILEELVHDSYKSKSKLSPSHCEECGAVYRRGRWRWGQAARSSRATVCPACRRTRDGMPAGYVSLAGEYFRTHRDEVLARVRNCESAEKREHPLERVMAVRANGAGALVTTTDAHLARRIGEALRKSFKGAIEFHYNRADNLLRVDWRR